MFDDIHGTEQLHRFYNPHPILYIGLFVRIFTSMYQVKCSLCLSVSLSLEHEFKVPWQIMICFEIDPDLNHLNVFPLEVVQK